ncbi:MAG: polyprenyl synthetase family protein [Candidatus Omnitrophota bacterium]
MFLKIKNRIEKELYAYIKACDKKYRLRETSPLLFQSIREFTLRKGKRIRPALFAAAYLGFKKRAPAGFFTTALSLELLHDFMLVHDDIIDKSEMRRGKPSMHSLLSNYLKRHKGAKFTGEDLAIIIGDVMYAMALDAFGSVKEDPRRKEKTLKKLIQAAFYTGCGEFSELLLGLKDIGKVTKEDIYKIYDFKTANYTFASPLSMGATLAGAGDKEIKLLFNYGINLGRAFQIKDDIIGIFSKTRETGKSNLTDLKEAKRTLLIWYAYNHTNKAGKTLIEKIMAGSNFTNALLSKARKVIKESAAVEYAKKEITSLLHKSEGLIKASRLKPAFKESLSAFSRGLLTF